MTDTYYDPFTGMPSAAQMPEDRTSVADAYRLGGLAAMDQYDFPPIRSRSFYDQFPAPAGEMTQPLFGERPQEAGTLGQQQAVDQEVGGMLVPQSPLDLGLYALGGPLSRGMKIGALAAGAALEPGDAQAGAGKLFNPNWWHGISANKLVKPMSEMFAETVPTQAIRERFISPEALQGGVLLPVPGDRAMAGERLVGVGGQRLDVPVDLQGGHGFMPANVDPGQVWASDKGIITTLANRAKNLADKYGDVYLPYTAMSERAVDFSHHMSDTLSEMVKNAKFLKTSKDETKATAASFDAAMKAAWGKDYDAVTNWPGINDPNLRQYLIDASGDVRNKFAKLLDTSKYQTGGFPNVAEARLAVTDPRLLYEPSGAAGLSIARANPNLITPSGHRTYNTALGGEYLGGFGQSIPKEVMYPDIFKAYAKRTSNPSQQDYLFRAGSAPFFQPTNQQWLEGVMQYLGQAK